MSTNPDAPWHRVFAVSDAVPSLEAIHGALTAHLPDLDGSYRYDDTGWIECTFQSANLRWTLSRYTRADDDIRGELQSWAAWLEFQEHSPHRQMLMEHLTRTRQVFVFQRAAGMAPNATAALCRLLSKSCDGVFQTDGLGFFAVDGALLLAET